MRTEFLNKVEDILLKDNRYHRDSYEFVMHALWFTQKKLKKNDHVSGKQLLEGVRDYTLEQYGPMARFLLKEWNINKTEDFGNIVFNMINAGLMRKTDEDRLEDFKDVYDFEKAFDAFKQPVKRNKPIPLTEK